MWGGASGVGAAITEIGATWAYSWTPDPESAYGGDAPAGVENVPMFAKHTTTDAADGISGSPQNVLGWNEPDKEGPDSATAISAWPAVYSTLSNGGSCRVGSPAVSTTSLQSGDWFYDFMQGVDNQVDFIALHYYSPSFSDVAGGVAALQQYIQSVYDMYQKPIWLTEYAMVDFTGDTGNAGSSPSQDVSVDFMQQSGQMLNGLISQGILERYAWFALPQGDGQPDTGMMDSGGQLNALGQAYAAL